MFKYKETMTTKINDGFTQLLKETSEFFAEKDVRIFGHGWKDVVIDNNLNEAYIEKLVQDLPADEVQDMTQLFENTRMHILEESSMNGIQAYSSLAFPIIRKMWTRLGMKSVIPTQVAKKPVLTVPWIQPYIVIDGVKHKLPEAFRDATIKDEIAEKKAIAPGVLALPVAGIDVMSHNGQTKLANDLLSTKFFVSKANMEVLDAADANAEMVAVKVKFERDLRNKIQGDVSAEHSDGTVTTDTIFGRIDCQTGLLDLVALNGAVKSVEVTGWFSSESHERVQEVTFEMSNRDINIPDGIHMDASVPKEFLTDTKALYDIDGAAKLIDILSNVFATKVDFQLQDFLEESYNTSCTQFTRSFSLRPSFGYTGSPKDWREEVKPVIDHLAISIQNETNYYQGVFILYGNPIDMRVIPNAEWTFVGSQSERGGVNVGFNIGAVTGDNAIRYSLVSIPNVPSGSIRMVFIPDLEDLLTYKYIPYTFSIESSQTGYRNPNRPNVPSITMMKRDTIEEFLPVCGKIFIENNDGTLPGQRPQVVP
jgi:hypothetical protein